MVNFRFRIYQISWRAIISYLLVLTLYYPKVQPFTWQNSIYALTGMYLGVYAIYYAYKLGKEISDEYFIKGEQNW